MRRASGRGTRGGISFPLLWVVPPRAGSRDQPAGARLDRRLQPGAPAGSRPGLRGQTKGDGPFIVLTAPTSDASPSGPLMSAAGTAAPLRDPTLTLHERRGLMTVHELRLPGAFGVLPSGCCKLDSSPEL